MVRAEFATTKNPEIIGEMQEGSCADGGGGGRWHLMLAVCQVHRQ